MPRARCSDELSAIHNTATRREDRPPSPITVMDVDEYRRRGKEMVEYIADYLETIRERRVFPDVKPGYLRELVPTAAPLNPEPWDDIFSDIERVVMPGVTHWQSPYMHAYFPALNSWPSLLGDMLADAINCLGFTWASSPACTELETVVMDWLAKMVGLPDHFLHACPDSHGGGVIQTTASEATFVCLLAARTEAIQRHQEEDPDLEDAQVNSRLVAYCSDQAHSSVEKAGLIGLVKMRYIESDDNLSMRGDKVVEAIHTDREKGLIPFFLCATLGTTGSCAFDNLQELGPICERETLWMHVDAAYAGTAFICPEFRHFMAGVEYAHSLAFNPSKWMMVHFDCTAMWVRNSGTLHRTFNVDPIYLQHENSGLAIDYMHWQIGLSKRFRALKLWFVIRSFGVAGLQKHIREGVRMAQKFEAFVRSDPRFEIPVARHLGMVVFRLKGDNELTEKLLKKLNSTGKLHCVPALLKGKYVIRFTVTSTHTTAEDLSRDWAIIRGVASEVLSTSPAEEHRAKVFLKDTRKNPDFGTSLLLANSPMSPKIVNGSFAAIFDNSDVLYEFAKKLQQLKLDVQDSPGKAMRRRIRGMLMAGKQYSLDSRMDLVTTLVQSAAPPDNLPTMREAGDEAQDFQDAGSQTDNEYSPVRGRSRSVDESIPTPSLKDLQLDPAIDESEAENSSPEADTKVKVAINGAPTWLQIAGYKNFPSPPNYDDIEIPKERQKLRVLQKVPQYSGNTRPIRMTKRLDLIRGEEEVHRELLLQQYGIVAKRGGMLHHGHIEMIRLTIAHKIDTSKMFAIWRIDAPWKPVTRLGQGKRMGGGKGSIDHYVTPIKAERIIVEIGGKCSFEEVRPILKMIAHKLPFPAVAVSKEMLAADRRDVQQLEDNNINPYTFKYLIQNHLLGCDDWIREIDRTYFGKYH